MHACACMRPPCASLVGGVAVADHLRQDPLLVPVHHLHPRRHLVALLGHVVAAGRDGAAQGRGAAGAGGADTLVMQQNPPEPVSVFWTPLSRLPDPQRQRHGGLLQERHQHAAPHRLPGGVVVTLNPRRLGGWKRRSSLETGADRRTGDG